MFDINPLLLLYRLPGIIIGFTLHEFAHAYVAYLLGDNTVKYKGRLTLNPMSHIDILGFIALMLAGFGWAKPVPVNPMYFKDRKKGMILVSIAGPLMNFFIAFILLLIYNILGNLLNVNNDIILSIIFYGYIINIGLGVFNLIPVPPLDGSKILGGLLPSKQEYMLYRYEQYGFIILLLLLYTGIIDTILGPPILFVDSAISNIIGMFF